MGKFFPLPQRQIKEIVAMERIQLLPHGPICSMIYRVASAPVVLGRIVNVEQSPYSSAMLYDVEIITELSPLVSRNFYRAILYEDEFVRLAD